MTTIKYPNGVTIQYDETIKVGDIIIAYHKGFHKVTKITPREMDISIYKRCMNCTDYSQHASPFITYVQIAKTDGSPAPQRINTCDASYCQHAKPFIHETVGRLNSILDKYDL
jgi:hypothetical protein